MQFHDDFIKSCEQKVANFANEHPEFPASLFHDMMQQISRSWKEKDNKHQNQHKSSNIVTTTASGEGDWSSYVNAGYFVHKDTDVRIKCVSSREEADARNADDSNDVVFYVMKDHDPSLRVDRSLTQQIRNEMAKWPPLRLLLQSHEQKEVIGVGGHWTTAASFPNLSLHQRLLINKVQAIVFVLDEIAEKMQQQQQPAPDSGHLHDCFFQNIVSIVSRREKETQLIHVSRCGGTRIADQLLTTTALHVQEALTTYVRDCEAALFPKTFDLAMHFLETYFKKLSRELKGMNEILAQQSLDKTYELLSETRHWTIGAYAVFPLMLPGKEDADLFDVSHPFLVASARSISMVNDVTSFPRDESDSDFLCLANRVHLLRRTRGLDAKTAAKRVADTRNQIVYRLEDAYANDVLPDCQPAYFNLLLMQAISLDFHFFYDRRQSFARYGWSLQQSA